jgi:hypothetical protein
MKVICNIGYEATHKCETVHVRIIFEKGKVYDTLSEYDSCYLFLINHDIYIIKKLYFLTLQDAFKRKKFSFNKQFR